VPQNIIDTLKKSVLVFGAPDSIWYREPKFDVEVDFELKIINSTKM
jgi:hypothetical protein